MYTDGYIPAHCASAGCGFQDASAALVLAADGYPHPDARSIEAAADPHQPEWCRTAWTPSEQVIRQALRGLDA